MEPFLGAILSNAAVATCIAILAFVLGRLRIHAGLVRALWLLVFVKLLTPAWMNLPGISAIPVEILPAAPHQHVHIQSSFASESATSSTWDSAVPHAIQNTASQTRQSHSGFLHTSNLIQERPLFLVQSFWKGFQSLALWISLIWAFGVVGYLVLTYRRWLQCHRLIRSADRAPAAVQELADALTDAYGFKRRLEVRVVEGKISPFLWIEKRQPVVVLPLGLIHQLQQTQLQAILAHELAHFIRRDHWVRWFVVFTAGLYWWLPVVWWAKRCLNDMEEICCDASVAVWFPHRKREYALALLGVTDFISNRNSLTPVVPAVIGSEISLKRRLEMFLKMSNQDRMSWKFRTGLVLFAGLILPCSLVWTQQDEPDKCKACGQAVKAAALAKESGVEVWFRDPSGDQADKNEEPAIAWFRGQGRQDVDPENSLFPTHGQMLTGDGVLAYRARLDEDANPESSFFSGSDAQPFATTNEFPAERSRSQAEAAPDVQGFFSAVPPSEGVVGAYQDLQEGRDQVDGDDPCKSKSPRGRTGRAPSVAETARDRLRGLGGGPSVGRSAARMRTPQDDPSRGNLGRRSSRLNTQGVTQAARERISGYLSANRQGQTKSNEEPSAGRLSTRMPGVYGREPNESRNPNPLSGLRGQNAHQDPCDETAKRTVNSQFRGRISTGSGQGGLFYSDKEEAEPSFIRGLSDGADPQGQPFGVYESDAGGNPEGAFMMGQSLYEHSRQQASPFGLFSTPRSQGESCPDKDFLIGVMRGEKGKVRLIKSQDLPEEVRRWFERQVEEGEKPAQSYRGRRRSTSVH